MNLLEKKSEFIFYDNEVEILITKRNFKNKIRFFHLHQIHSDIFHYINFKNNFFLKGDGILTDLKNFPICIKTADCLTIFIFTKEIIGAVHCGWRSTSKRILEKIIDFLIKEIKIYLNDIKFLFSHCICEKCYTVKEDMKKIFIKNYGYEGKKFFKKFKKDTFLFDLKNANLNILLNHYKIKKNSILIFNKCTVCNNNEFYSFRKERTTYRNFNIIKLKKEEC